MGNPFLLARTEAGRKNHGLEDIHNEKFLPYFNLD